MANSLDKKLSELTSRAKRAEDSINTAAHEDAEKIKSRGEKLRADAAQRQANLTKSAESAKSSVNSAWAGMAGQVQSNIDEIREKIQVKKGEIDRNRATRAADDAEENAASAIDFALYSIDIAETAALEAVAAREAADAMKAA